MKNYSIILFFLLVSFSVKAQRFEGGILGGLSASQVDGDFTRGYHKPGFTAGAFVKTDLSRSFYAGMEIKYAQKGSRRNPDADTGDQSKYIMRLGYMDVPVYIGVRTSEVVSFIAGLSAGYLVHSNEYDNYGKFPSADERPFNDIDVQGLIGTRFELSRKITLDLRFAYSVLPVRELEGDIFWYWWDDQYNNVLTITLCYRFGR
ncbi:porin family protein [Sunxiuqinia sp. A32]|uniref:porin family protein n=1 Tax=Sunxiuqinia sp. A32 TaxID=3461496 RepID=UPI004045CFA6